MMAETSTDPPGPGTRTPSRPLPVDGLADAARTFLRQPSGRVLAGQAVVFAVLRARRGRPSHGDAAILAVVLAWWPLQEWVAHRYILHAPPRRVMGRTLDPVVARMHRAHHADPWQHTGLPLAFLVAAVPLHVVVWLLLTRDRTRALTGMLAYGSTTLAYEWTHFLTHTSYRPRRSYFARLQRRHRLHHFRDEHHWLGFTVPWVDDLFGTAPDPSTVPRSATVRSLGIDEPGRPGVDSRVG